MESEGMMLLGRESAVCQTYFWRVTTTIAKREWRRTGRRMVEWIDPLMKRRSNGHLRLYLVFELWL